MGRPTKYKQEYDEQAYKLCLLDATDIELADFFGVTEQTINNWKYTNDGDETSFFEAIKRGKLVADAEAAHKLHKRATGYTAVERRISADGSVSITEKDIPPDTGALAFWLKNRTRRYERPWTDKQEIEHKHSGVIETGDSRELARRMLSLLDIAKREGEVIDLPIAHRMTTDVTD